MKQILVVDNHPVMLDFMTRFLSSHGYGVHTAEDGVAALNILKSVIPDVIFLDLIMPNIDGEKLCRIIRNNPKLRNAHLVVLSAIAAEKKIDIEKLGADACIAKGSFKKMPEHVLSVLAQLDKKTSNGLGKKVIGIEDVRSRTITKELLSSKKHFELILDNITEGIFELNLEGKIIYANPTAVSITGLLEEELLSEEFTRLFKGSHYQKIQDLMKKMQESYQPVMGDSPLVLKGHEVSLNILPVKDEEHPSVIIIINDVTERNQMEAQLQRAEKMKAIGSLAGGVAHDLNNILSGLVSYPELLLMEIANDSPLKKPIQTIQKSGEKAVAIVQDLLTLARRGVSVTEIVNLNQIITDYLTSPEFKKLKEYHPNVQVDTDLDKNLFNVIGSIVHLSKTVMNLVSNASEAMPQGGRILISTANRYVDQPIKGYDNVQEGDYATLSVSDAGLGISPEEMEQIFEPFYTKKIMGRSGTGLGMTVVYGTVKDHNGYIDIKSTVGEGTVFTLFFPITRDQYQKSDKLLEIEDYMGHGERILVVDDVEEQRVIASEMLDRLGYSVTAVSTGEEAIEHLKENPVDLVLLDMIMDPGMSGLSTYKEMIKIFGRKKAVITSGFSETTDVTEAQKLGAGKYIRKPYTLENIGIAIKEELKNQ